MRKKGKEDSVDVALQEVFQEYPGDTTARKILDAAFMSREAVISELLRVPNALRNTARDRVLALFRDNGIPENYTIEDDELHPSPDRALATLLGVDPFYVEEFASALLVDCKTSDDTEKKIAQIASSVSPVEVREGVIVFLRNIGSASHSK